MCATPIVKTVLRRYCSLVYTVQGLCAFSMKNVSVSYQVFNSVNFSFDDIAQWINGCWLLSQCKSVFYIAFTSLKKSLSWWNYFQNIFYRWCLKSLLFLTTVVLVMLIVYYHILEVKVKFFLQTPFTAIISNITPSKTYSTKLDNLKLKN